jgi:purine-binding chemotaxis protein CheW
MSVVALRTPTSRSNETVEYLTFAVADQQLAIPATVVRDVLRLPKLTPVPLAPADVAGLMNLRGHIVTAVDLSARLGFGSQDPEQRRMAIVIAHGTETLSLVVDAVGDVQLIANDNIGPNPASMPQVWQGISNGVFSCAGKLTVALDIEKTLSGL